MGLGGNGAAGTGTLAAAESTPKPQMLCQGKTSFLGDADTSPEWVLQGDLDVVGHGCPWHWEGKVWVD